MADYAQLELFDLEPYISRNSPDIYVVQTKKRQGIENEQLELNLFPDESDARDFKLNQAA